MTPARRSLLCTVLLAPAPLTLWAAQPVFQLDAPAGTRGFALVIENPKGRGGLGSSHCHYARPCTPRGRPQSYLFSIIATDLDPKALPPGPTLAELRDKLARHAIASTGLVGLFAHPD